MLWAHQQRGGIETTGYGAADIVGEQHPGDRA
jgi:hypothetical protein